MHAYIHNYIHKCICICICIYTYTYTYTGVYGEQKPTDGPHMGLCPYVGSWPMYGPGHKTLNLQALAFAACLLLADYFGFFKKEPTFGGQPINHMTAHHTYIDTYIHTCIHTYIHKRIHACEHERVHIPHTYTHAHTKYPHQTTHTCPASILKSLFLSDKPGYFGSKNVSFQENKRVRGWSSCEGRCLTRSGYYLLLLC